MSHHYLKFSNVSFSYPDNFEALKNISFTIEHGEKVAIIGNNGAGKSTLLQHMNGLLLPSKGEITLGDIKICKQTLPLVRQSVGMIFQNADDQLFMPTVYDDVAFGPQNMKLPPDDVEYLVKTALESVNAFHLKDRASHQLSGGQKRIVAIATVLSMQPNILVMDEPSANLDLKSRKNLINIIKSFTHSCIIATHDLELALELCERAILLENGIISGDSTTKNIIASYQNS